MIHPTALIAPNARLHETVRVGPYAVIDADVEVEDTHTMALLIHDAAQRTHHYREY